VGFATALAAFGIWGLSPIYWRQLRAVPALEVLAHRVLWSVLLTGAFLLVVGRGPKLLSYFRDWRTLRWSLLSSVLISLNGLVFIWGVSVGRITELSLGYYINPLLNAALGFLFLGERPGRLQRMAIGLAALAVLVRAVAAGVLPWLSLLVAACFGFYGLVRKVAPMPALEGLNVEMTLASPLALLYLALGPAIPGGALLHGDAAGGSPLWIAGLLVLSGVVSALPLFLFAFGARRLTYTTVGVMMYVAPTLQLLLAVVVYGEPFTEADAATFLLLWSGIVLYLVGSYQGGPDGAATRPSR
jgi:chloramphenicol-sensitive protein RarD